MDHGLAIEDAASALIYLRLYSRRPASHRQRGQLGYVLHVDSAQFLTADAIQSSC